MRIFIIRLGACFFAAQRMRAPISKGAEMASKLSNGVPTSHRLGVASRIAAAALGGYLLASLSSICLAWTLPLARPEAVVSSMMLAFIVYLIVVLWCFACRSASRAWAGIALPALALALADGALYWVNTP
jgi:protein-S-isoprenylcysteine O-methyltransferase Ste14